MPDKASEFIEQMIDQRLKDIAEELKNISIMLEGFKAEAEKETKLSDKLMGRLQGMQSAIGRQHYLSGRWPLRDGDSYGIVPAQPNVTEKVGPKIDGNDPTGHLRSSDERGD
ncbi:MAG TPA: hypothetical protein VGJ20_20390 [Xanthobacteraceae bacterium]|jgi:hypothetical protein